MDSNTHYGSTGKPHPYHLVRPSPWPLLGAFAGGLLAVGALLYFHSIEIAGHKVGLNGVYAGLLAVLLVMFFWWKDVIREAVVEKAHSPEAKVGLRYGMALFIASEVMFFFAFFWAFFDASLFPGSPEMPGRSEHTQGIWPPPGIHPVDPFDLPFLMTMILLLSGCAVTWAHHALLHNARKDAAVAVFLSGLLGVIFLGFQAYEYLHAHFGFTDGIFASTFYMATGFHGFHVLVGTIFLFVCLFRTLKKHFTADSHFGFEAAAWYWHFVDVVWLFLFISIYWWGGVR